MGEKAYYLVNFNSLDLNADFNVFLSYLSKIPELSLTSDENQTAIKYEDSNIVAFLKKIPTNTPGTGRSSMMLQCDAKDFNTPRLFRNLVSKLHYRIYNPALGCFLPRNTDLEEISQVALDDKTVETLRVKRYNPVSIHLSTDIVFAQPSGKPRVHIIL